MGGTSADISVVSDSAIGQTPEGEIDGLPVRLPMIEIRTIGAGGGSLARVEAGGLRVGPESAGAMPGPVSYKRGGTQPAVTDANVALARIDAPSFLGGAMPLDDAGARNAIAEHVGAPLGLGAEAAAAGVLEVADAHMGDAIRLSLFEKGADPADFALAPFGGAAGLHAAAIADSLDMRRMVLPANASTLSARGILAADLRHDLARSRRLRANTGGEADAVAALQDMAADLRAEAEAALIRDGVEADARAYEFSADMRYRGQAYELVIPWGDVAPSAASLADLVQRFHIEHAARFAHSDEADVVEIATLRLAAIGRCRTRSLQTLPAHPAILPHRFLPAAGAYGWMNAWVEAAIYQRGDIDAGASLTGPAIIEEAFTTLVVPARWTVTMTPSGDMLAEKN